MSVRGSISRIGAVALTASLVIAGQLAIGSPAQAAGSASLSVSISPVDTFQGSTTLTFAADHVVPPTGALVLGALLMVAGAAIGTAHTILRRRATR